MKLLPLALLGLLTTATTFAVLTPRAQDTVTGPGGATASAQDPAERHLRAPQPWEYKVVGLTEIHENTLDALKGMVDDARSGENDLLEWALKADERLVTKTQAVLDEHGAEGWELVEYRENVLVFKRPKL